MSKSLWAAVGLVCSVSAHSAPIQLGTFNPGTSLGFGGSRGVSTFEFTWQASQGVGNLLAGFASNRPAPITAVILDGSAVSFSSASSPQIVNLFNGVLTPGVHTFTVTASSSWTGTISAASASLVPEPGALALALGGLGVVASMRRQRQVA